MKEYATYVAKVRKYAQNMKLEKAVNRAVDECIKEKILTEFLQANRAEVVALSIFEYDKEEEEKKLRKAEYEAGIEAGREIGKREGKIAGERIGRVVGEKIGRITGIIGIIETCVELHVPENDIITKLQEKMKLSKEDAWEYLEKYKRKEL